MYRYVLMKYWRGRCALTGVSESILLRASHAKPWKDCTDAERLDVHNGLLLVIHLDTAFDAGLITIGEDGGVIPSARLGQVERRVLGLEDVKLTMPLRAAHEPYLAWHREHVFQQ
jgi:putative restriction endonuclease